MGFEEPSKILPIGKSLFRQSNCHLPKERVPKKEVISLLLLIRRFSVDNSKMTPYIQWKSPVDNSVKPVDK